MASGHSDSDTQCFLDTCPAKEEYSVYTTTIRSTKVPLIIDNGSYKCRSGWATDKKPRLNFKNLVARLRGKKEDILVGNDIGNLDAFKCQLKSQFDRDVVMYYDTQEQILDHIFSHLSISTDGCVDHPVLMTEPLFNPNYFRQQMSELLFECYNIPKVAYGVDCLFSFFKNVTQNDTCDALIISCGYQTTHIIPVLQGQVVTEHCRRIDVGGFQCDSYMMRLLQLKHSGLYAQVPLARAEELMHRFSRVSTNYQHDCKQWFDADFYDKNVIKIQLPFNAAVTKVDPETQKQRRAEQARRLRQIAIKKREEELSRDQDRLQELLFALNLLKEEDDEHQYQNILQKLNFKSEDELKEEVNNVNNKINRIVNRMQEMVQKDQGVESDERAKTGDAKRARMEKKPSGLDIMEPPVGKEEAMRTWLEGLRTQRQQIVMVRDERHKRKVDMTKRRTHASQERMKIITSLAQGKKSKKEDTFGMKDEDWNVYKEINKDGGGTDSEGEQEKLDELDSYLKAYDPQYKDPNGSFKEMDLKEYYRLHVAIEQIRCPEVLFQPSLIGVEQAGISETIEFILKKFPSDEQIRLVQNVLVTGGCALFRHIQQRLESDLMSILPFQSKFKVSLASDPTLDAWFGAQKWLRQSKQDIWVTRQDYLEKGGEYLKQSRVTNHYVATPKKVENSSAV